MNWLTVLLVIYLIIINIAGFVLMGNDKARAEKQKWRIPEKTFFILSAAGAGAGTLAGMYVFRHKTKHWYFEVFIPLIMAAWIIFFLLIISGVI